jgi:hypothetical protein
MCVGHGLYCALRRVYDVLEPEATWGMRKVPAGWKTLEDEKCGVWRAEALLHTVSLSQAVRKAGEEQI